MEFSRRCLLSQQPDFFVFGFKTRGLIRGEGYDDP
jgi:hypothetical protein